MAVAYLGLGGNVGDSRENLKGAIEKLDASEAISILRVSRFYRTAPVGGPNGQADYVNCVVAADTTLSPRGLLHYCLFVEREYGRTRTLRWGPRTLDIDLLLFDDLVIDEPSLEVPHPLMRKRLFVLIPLRDVASPDMSMPPDGRLLRDVLDKALNDPDLRNQDCVVAV